MMRAATCAVLAVLLLATATPLRAQGDLQEQIQTLAMENAHLYITPIMNGLGYALGSGFAETGRAHRVLGFDIGLRVMAAMPPTSAEMFTAVVPASVTYNGTTYNDPYGSQTGDLRTPTAVGTGPGVVLVPQGSYRTAIIMAGENPNDFNVEFPEGLDIPAVPFAVAQASIGLPYQTEFTVRLIPAITPDDEIGEISAFGFGVKHTVTQWLPASPVDVALFIGRQSFDVGDWMDATATTVGAIVSRTFGPLTAFGQLRSATGDVNVGYTVDNPDNNPALPAHGSRVSFNTSIPGGTHAGVGLTIRLIGLGISGEYSAGPYPTASIKAGLSIR